MQLNKKLIVLATTLGAVPLLQAADTNEVGFKYTHYEENDNRMKIDYLSTRIKKDLNLDYTLNLMFSNDSISGGTPIWQDTASGGSDVCKKVNGTYLCGEAKDNKSHFEYKNKKMTDTRQSLNISLTKRTQKRNEITFGGSYSKEEDFKSLGGSLSVLYNLDDTRNRNVAIGGSVQLNNAKHGGTWKAFNALNLDIEYAQAITKDTLASIGIFAIQQNGVLDNPYQRVIRYFYNHLKYYLAKEKKPKKRSALGISAKVASKILPKTTINMQYRIYKDDWGVLSDTVSAKIYIDLADHFTITSFARYYLQSSAVFYKDNKAKNNTFGYNNYATNDDRLGAYYTRTYGIGAIGKVTKNTNININYTIQEQSNGLLINYVSLGMNYSF